ncbi:MAG: hypothetical protein MAG795_00115 [Candidatus Woesearchaeota archaeon]|nr:hypothetical protein [Candidatus Woesearchaeota archaeon]
MKLKLSTLELAAGIIGLLGIGIFLSKYPIFMYYFLILILPCFGLTYLLKFDFTFVERILISFFTGSLFLIPIDFLSIINIPINSTTILITTLTLPLVITYFLKKHIKINKDIVSSIKSNGWTILCITLIILTTFYIWKPLLQSQKLPMSDQVVNWAFTKEEVDEINEHQRIPIWGSDFSGGFPLFLFDSYFYYERLATLKIILPSEFSLTYIMNTHAFFSVIMIALGIFALGKRLGLNKLRAILAVIMFNINPFIASKFAFSGDIKELTAFAVVPMIFLVMTLKKPKKFLLLSLLLTFLYYSHMILFLFISAIITIYYVTQILIQKKILKSELKYIVLGAVLTFLLVSSHLVTFALNMDFPQYLDRSSKVGISSLFRIFIKPYFSQPTASFSYNIGTGFSIFALISALSLMVFSIANNKKQPLLLITLSFLIFILIMSLVPGIGNKLLGFIGSDRTNITFVMICALLIASFITFSENQVAKFVPLVLMVVLFVLYAGTTKNQMNNWVTETSQNNVFQPQYQKLEQLGPGRLINYGIFAYSTETAVPALSELGMITHTNPFAKHVDPQSEFKDGSESKLSTKYEVPYIINRLRTTFTKYIFIFKCDRARQGWLTEKIFQEYEQKPFNLNKVHQEECITIYQIPKTNYVESAKISLIKYPREIAYNFSEGWKLIGFLNPQDYNEFGYDYTVDTESDLKVIPDPIAYNYTFINNDHIKITGEFKEGWIVVKDTYFKAWHAYMGDQELLIRESNLGTMLIKTKPGNQIDLVIKPFSYQYFFGFIGTLTLLIIFIFSSRLWGKK